MMNTYAEYAVKGDSEARNILSPAHNDALGEAILALTSEVWVLTDRLMVLEEVLKTTGVDVTAAIESFAPTPELEKRLDARRDRLIAAVVDALAGAK
jgi:hypothetical protein